MVLFDHVGVCRTDHAVLLLSHQRDVMLAREVR